MARETGAPLTLPSKILSEEGRDEVGRGESDSESLKLEHDFIEDSENRRLKIELNAAIHRLEQLPCELAEKNKYIAKLMRSLDRSRERVEDMHNRVVAIRKRFGVEPAQPPIEGEISSDDG